MAVENDANCCALYDQVHRREAYSDLLHLLIWKKPFTIGAGMVLNGRLFRGTRGAAGEVPDELAGDETIEIATSKVVRFLVPLLDLDAVFLSSDPALNRKLGGEDPPAEIKRLASDLQVGLGCPVFYAGDNDVAVTGASMLAMRVHTERLLNVPVAVTAARAATHLKVP